jgi:diaminopimelate epimerase
MTGSGNDFVVLDGRATAADGWPPARVRAICDRRNGVGADGLVILTPSTPGAVRMSYWNSDGSSGAMCGNAALCSGRLSVDLEMVPPGEFCLLTDAGLERSACRISWSGWMTSNRWTFRDGGGCFDPTPEWGRPGPM